MSSLSSETPAPLSALRLALQGLHRCDETTALAALLPLATLPEAGRQRVRERAGALVRQLRARQHMGEQDAAATLLHEYALSSSEGLALMSLAEALLRIPDAATADRLIRDKLGQADWARHVPHSDSFFVSIANWALTLTGQLVHPEDADDSLVGVGKNLLARASSPLIREALRAAMRKMGEQFILGQDMNEALERARKAQAQGWRHSFDMLGEAAMGQEDAQRYAAAYRSAILRLGDRTAPLDDPAISIKLSALHPRYEVAQRNRVMKELLPCLVDLVCLARDQGVSITLDAEESDRLELSLDLFEALAFEPRLAGWDGLGLAVQAYQKRAPAVLDWLAELARCSGHRWKVRLVKGAYWDSEIKLAQERGLSNYPVHTSKAATDLSWLACAAKLLDDPQAFYPQFATHNAFSVASVLEMAAQRGIGDFEFQRLHGMGQFLYEALLPQCVCRVYAPVGSHVDLLAYLVRRLLENGANTSFVHLLEDERIPLEALITDPVEQWLTHRDKPGLPIPPALFAPQRHNSVGMDLNDLPTLARLEKALVISRQTTHRAESGFARAGAVSPSNERTVLKICSPANGSEWIGEVSPAQPDEIELALKQAVPAARQWDSTPATERAACLERAANLFEREGEALMALILREGGRTRGDALSEWREAIDFCRYYAAQARETFGSPRELPGPTGERNRLSLHGRGVFACISPWNFPLAIFTGQIAAALAAGNAVLAKPAEQTPLTAALAVSLLHEAGIPPHVLQFLPGDGQVGARLVDDERIDGVAFTGSSETARQIHQCLARHSRIATFIAETGGLNVMIADSSTLPEQLVRDVLQSAFNSAGQRCSALRVLYLQEDIADRVLHLLLEAMQELVVGDPACIETDIGPLIDSQAFELMQAHLRWLEDRGRCVGRVPLPDNLPPGHYFAPQVWEIQEVSALTEVFGPILHIIRWPAQELDRVLKDIDALPYGLTLGIHSRIDETIQHIVSAVRVGNIYVNRNMIGAVVGVQPFGGERLSGTGPKAGGPHTLLRFATERCLTVNTVAAGGNVQLLTGSPSHFKRPPPYN